jgi:hypothetical protein
MSRRRLYIAGKMTGIPHFNFPAFDALAEDLRHTMVDDSFPEVVSPAEMDDPASRSAAMASPDGAPGSGSSNGETWGDFLARDVKLISDGGIDGIVLVEGNDWQKSRGCLLETFVAHLNGIPIYTVQRTYDRRIILVQASRLTLYRAWTKEPDLYIEHAFGQTRKP